MTKKVVLFVGLLSLAVFILAGSIIDGEYCRYVNEYGHTTNYCEIITSSLLSVILLVPFSVILYFLPDEIFRAWWRFARCFVPIAVVLTLLTPHDRGGGWGIPTLLDPEFVGIVSALLFAALSFCIIAWKIIVFYHSKKKERK